MSVLVVILTLVAIQVLNSDIVHRGERQHRNDSNHRGRYVYHHGIVHGHNQATVDLKHLIYIASGIEIDLTLLLTSIIITYYHSSRTRPRTSAVIFPNHKSCNHISDSTHLKPSFSCQQNFVSVHRSPIADVLLQDEVVQGLWAHRVPPVYVQFGAHQQ